MAADDVVSHLLRLSNMIKLFHLSTKNESLYKASDELYRNINSIVDKIAEVHQGYTEKILTLVIKESARPDDLVPLIQKSREYILSQKDSFEPEVHHMINVLATSMSQFLYKARLK